MRRVVSTMIVLSALIVVGGCASKRAPIISVRSVVEQVVIVQDRAGVVAAQVERLVEEGCITATQGTPALIAIKAIYDASAAIGRAYQSYLASADAIQKARARTDILDQVVILGEQIQRLVLDVIKGTIETLRTDAIQLRAAAIAAAR